MLNSILLFVKLPPSATPTRASQTAQQPKLGWLLGKFCGPCNLKLASHRSVIISQGHWVSLGIIGYHWYHWISLVLYSYIILYQACATVRSVSNGEREQR